MPPHAYTDANRQATLMILRVIWLAFIVGQVSFGTVAVLMTMNAEPAGQDHLRGQMLAIASGVFIGAVGLGYFARNQSYKKHWREHAVAPPGFFQGNLILLAALEGASFLAIVFVMLSGQVFPMVLPAVASLAVQCANFPSGQPMQPAVPEFSKPKP